MPFAVILTAIPIEYTAVRSHLSNLQEVTHPQGTIYEKGKFLAYGKEWDVVIVETGAGNSPAGIEAERAIACFDPDVILFVGVAGGIKDVKLGDVVAGTKVYGYESGKEAETFKPRPDVGLSTYNMIQRARAEAKKIDWLARVSSSAKPNVYVAPIAAGEKVVANKESDLFKFLQNNYGDALAVEMEGRGILQAAHANQQVSALIIRGISDLIDGKSKADGEGYQEIAAHHASAFAFEILAKFDPTIQNQNSSQNKQSSVVNVSDRQESNNFLTAQEKIQLRQVLAKSNQLRTADERTNFLIFCGLEKFCNSLQLADSSDKFSISICNQLSKNYVDNGQKLALVVFLEYLIQLDSSLSQESKNFIEYVINKKKSGDFEVSGKFSVTQNHSITQKIEGVELDTTNLQNQINIQQLSQEISNNLGSNLNDERHQRINYARELIKQGKFKQALDYLNDLKKELWQKADNKIKYRLLANIGIVDIGLGFAKGASKLIEAKQYNPDDETALGLAAKGHILYQEYEQAETLIQRILEKNPANTLAYSCRVYMADKNDSIDDILNKVPKLYRNEPDILTALATVAFERKLYNEAEEWLQSAIDLTQGYKDDLKMRLATIILEPVTQDNIFLVTKQLSENNQEKLEKAVNLFTEFLDGSLDNSDNLSPNELIALTNRSIAFRLLGKYNEAIQDIDKILNVKTNNAEYIKQRALLAHKKGNNEEAYEFLQKIISNPETPEASILAVNCLIALKRFDEAQKILEQFQQTEGNEDLKQAVQQLKFQIYFELKEYENAQKIVDNLLTEYPDDTGNLIYQIKLKTKITNQENLNDELNKLIEKAKNSLLLNSPLDLFNCCYLAELAQELYHLKYYRDAAEIYEHFVDKSLNSPETNCLINAYYYSGNYKKALELCNQLLDKYGALKYISEMSAWIHENIGNLAESCRICEEYLTKFPDDKVMQLRLAYNRYLQRNYDEVDKFLDKNISIEDLDLCLKQENSTYNMNKSTSKSNINEEFILNHCFDLARLYKFRQRFDDFINIIYETRRKFYNAIKVHTFYSISYMEIKRDESPNLEKVTDGCGVLIRYDNGKEKWYILDDRIDADFAKDELNSSQEFYNTLINKKLGDKITNQDLFEPKTFTIISIQDKYFVAGKQSLEKIDELPNVKYFQAIHVPITEDGMKEWLEKLDEMLKEQEDQFNTFNIKYQECQIPLGCFANIINKNPLELWGILANREDCIIHSWSNFNHEKFNDTLTILKQGGLIVIDPISLQTIYQLNIADEVVKALGKLGISQSTFDLFQNIFEETKGWESKGFSSIGMVNGKRLLQEFTPEQVSERKKYFEKLIEWINNNCDILPCWRALEIDTGKRQELNEVFGSAFVDTMLIAQEPGRILYSDDQFLRFYASYKDSLTRGVWTQVVLNYCHQRKFIDEEKYRKATLQLACLGYDYTIINSHILLEAARQSKWEVNSYSPFNQVLKFVSDIRTKPDYAISISCEFIYQLYGEAIIPNIRDTLIFELLKKLTAKRSQEQTINQLKQFIHKKFILIPIQEKEVFDLIKIWQDCQTIIT